MEGLARDKHSFLFGSFVSFEMIKDFENGPLSAYVTAPDNTICVLSSKQGILKGEVLLYR